MRDNEILIQLVAKRPMGCYSSLMGQPGLKKMSRSAWLYAALLMAFTSRENETFVFLFKRHALRSAQGVCASIQS
jgi:hypothetical protein